MLLLSHTPWETAAAAKAGVGLVILLNKWDVVDEDARALTEDSVADRRLDEHAVGFSVRAVVEIDGPAADPSLMPDFPGIAESDHCRDWEPGTPVDLQRIRDKDEAYWDDHRGTPKAFVDLAAGRAMWSSRFGALTAVRFPAQLERPVLDALREDLDPAARFQGVVKIYLDRFEDRVHGAGHTLGVEEIVVRLEVADRAAVFLGNFYQVFVTAAQQVFIGNQKRDQVVGPGVKRRFPLQKPLAVLPEFIQAGIVLGFR